MCYLQKTSSQQFHSLTFFCKCWMHDNAVVSEISRMTKASLNDRYVNQQGDIPANIRLDEDVLKTSFVFVFRRRLQDVLIKTNMFVLALRLQKTSSRRLGQDQYIHLGHTSSRRLQYILPRRLQDIFKTSSRLLAKMSARHLQGVFKTFCRRLQDVSSS